MQNQIKELQLLADTLAQYGLSTFLINHGYGHYLPFNASRKNNTHQEPYALANAILALGNAYQLFGNYLSQRSDVLPSTYRNAFSRIDDSAPSQETLELCTTIERDFQQPYHHVFSSIQPTPLRSTIISQTHKAQTTQGDQVLVTIQRPDIKHTLTKQIEILRFIAQKHYHKTKNEASLTIVEHFLTHLRQNVDYKRQAKLLLTLPGQQSIPKYSREHVLTTLYPTGKPATTPDERTAILLAKTYFKHCITHGLYPQSPVLNNIFVDAQRVNFLTYHPEQILNEDKHLLLQLVQAKGPKDALQAILARAQPTPKTHIPTLLREIEKSKSLPETLSAASTHLNLPLSVLRINQSITILDYTISTLAPNLNLTKLLPNIIPQETPTVYKK